MVSAGNWCVCVTDRERERERERVLCSVCERNEAGVQAGEQTRKKERKKERKNEREREILGVIYNVAAMLFPSPRVCGSSAVCVALRETPDKDRAGVAADALAGEIHLVTQHAK